MAYAVGAQSCQVCFFRPLSPLSPSRARGRRGGGGSAVCAVPSRPRTARRVRLKGLPPVMESQPVQAAYNCARRGCRFAVVANWQCPPAPILVISHLASFICREWIKWSLVSDEAQQSTTALSMFSPSRQLAGSSFIFAPCVARRKEA